MNYKEICEKSMPVTFDSVDFEDDHEVERMWLAGMVDGKWVEDYVVVRRDTYDTMTDEYGAVFALIANGRMLVKAPNVKHYRIPEDVYRIAANAFMDCNALEELDVPYMVDDFEIDNALKQCDHQFKVHLWNWSYNSKRSEQLEKEIAEGWTDEKGFVYSQDRKRLLKAANVGIYKIPEGVERIDRLAFVHCIFEELHVSHTCNFEKLPIDECTVFGSERVQGCVYFWDKPYPEVENVALIKNYFQK